MKKIFLTLALAAFAFAANAQNFVVGGNFQLNHNGGNTHLETGDVNNASNANTSFSILPKVGYQLNDKMQLGIQLGAMYQYGRTYATVLTGDNYDNYTSDAQTMWMIAPYFRYNIAPFSKFTFFCEAQAACGITPKAKYYNNVTGNSTDGIVHDFDLAISIIPGLNYRASNHISFDLYLNLLGFAYNYGSSTSEYTTGDITTTQHSFSFIGNTSAQTLNNHLNNFTLGFNYHF